MEKARRVVLPQPIEAEAVALLEAAGCELLTAEDPQPGTVQPLLAGARGMVLRTGIRITPDLLAHAADLEVISRTGGGLDNVDVAAATQGGVIVTSNLGVNTSSVVEHALALMLALSKQLNRMDQAVRNGNFKIRYRNLPRDLRGKTLGLLGFGRIGSELARACRQVFGMRVIAFDPYVSAAVRKKYAGQIDFVAKETLLAATDVLSIHVPLTEETRHAIGGPELARMKPDALLINTSRGPVVDESALIETLRANRIGGAGLDVLAQEPPPDDSPLLSLDNVILTPHTAALTRECVIRMATEAAQCVVDVFTGREPPNVANREVLSTPKWKHLIPWTPES